MTRRPKFALALVGLALVAGMRPAAAQPPVLLELFTSQGCSSCPPAEALLEKFSTRPDVLALSYHVSYWDNLGWKDPFASAGNTARQYAYAKAMGRDGVFTPELIVAGRTSMIGSDEAAAMAAIAADHGRNHPIDLALIPGASGFTVHAAGAPAGAVVMAARFVARASTAVTAGENGGRTLASVDNVTSIEKLGLAGPDYKLTALHHPDDGLAVFVQAGDYGPVLAVAAYRAP